VQEVSSTVIATNYTTNAQNLISIMAFLVHKWKFNLGHTKHDIELFQ